MFKLSPATKIGVSVSVEVKYKTKGNVALSSDGSALSNTHTCRVGRSGRASDVKAKIDVPTLLYWVGRINSTIAGNCWVMFPGPAGVRFRKSIFSAPRVSSMARSPKPSIPASVTWRFAVGANYRIDDAWKLKLGVAYDQTPVPNAAHRLTSLPDNDRTWLSVGAQWRPNKTSTLDMGLTYLYVKDPKISNDQRADVRGLVSGSYDASIWILGAQYSMAF